MSTPMVHDDTEEKAFPMRIVRNEKHQLFNLLFFESPLHANFIGNQDVLSLSRTTLNAAGHFVAVFLVTSCAHIHNRGPSSDE